MDKKLNLSTEKGCRKILAILLCIVLLASFFAQLISTNFGSVKISTLTIDSRGAELDIDLYVKRNVSDSDKLPCVLLAHGRLQFRRQSIWHDRCIELCQNFKVC